MGWGGVGWGGRDRLAKMQQEIHVIRGWQQAEVPAPAFPLCRAGKGMRGWGRMLGGGPEGEDQGRTREGGGAREHPWPAPAPACCVESAALTCATACPCCCPLFADAEEQLLPAGTMPLKNDFVRWASLHPAGSKKHTLNPIP